MAFFDRLLKFVHLFPTQLIVPGFWFSKYGVPFAIWVLGLISYACLFSSVPLFCFQAVSFLLLLMMDCCGKRSGVVILLIFLVFLDENEMGSF